MAKFIYRMQNILNLDEKLEEQAKMEYATQQMVLNEEEEKEQQLKDRRAAYEEEARRLREESLKVRDMIANANAISIMGGMIEEQHGAVKKEEEKLEAKRQALEEAMKDRKTQEKLKEKAFEQFMEEEKEAESKEVDERTSFTYTQRAREEQ